MKPILMQFMTISYSYRLLFWTDHGTKPPFVKKANMDGTNVISSGIVLPNGLAIDTAGMQTQDGFCCKRYVIPLVAVICSF